MELANTYPGLRCSRGPDGVCGGTPGPRTDAGAAMLLQKKAVQALDELDISELTPQEILRFISEGAKLEAANRAASTQQAAEAGEKKAASLADTIISAYQRRKEAGDGD